MNKLIESMVEKARLNYVMIPQNPFIKEDLENLVNLVVDQCVAAIEDAIPDTNCSASGPYKTAKIAALANIKERFKDV